MGIKIGKYWIYSSHPLPLRMAVPLFKGKTRVMMQVPSQEQFYCVRCESQQCMKQGNISGYQEESWH